MESNVTTRQTNTKWEYWRLGVSDENIWLALTFKNLLIDKKVTSLVS